MKRLLCAIIVLSVMLCCVSCTAAENGETENSVEIVESIETNENTETDENKENTENKENSEKLDFLPLDFYFSSGAGGWSTDLTLNPDGTFTGKYHDSEMGSTGEGYPYGTYYICEFVGAFANITKVNDYTYTMQLDKIALKDEVNKEWIEDGVKYIASYPYGLEESVKFKLLTPDAPISEFSEDFLLWWPGRYEEEQSDTLGHYCIMNIEKEYGFFAY